MRASGCRTTLVERKLLTGPPPFSARLWSGRQLTTKIETFSRLRLLELNNRPPFGSSGGSLDDRFLVPRWLLHPSVDTSRKMSLRLLSLNL